MSRGWLFSETSVRVENKLGIRSTRCGPIFSVRFMSFCILFKGEEMLGLFQRQGTFRDRETSHLKGKQIHFLEYMMRGVYEQKNDLHLGDEV